MGMGIMGREEKLTFALLYSHIYLLITHLSSSSLAKCMATLGRLG